MLNMITTKYHIFFQYTHIVLLVLVHGYGIWNIEQSLLDFYEIPNKSCFQILV